LLELVVRVGIKIMCGLEVAVLALEHLSKACAHERVHSPQPC